MGQSERGEVTITLPSGQPDSNPAALPQPAPLQGTTEVLPLVIADLQARADMGEKKYGTRLTVENGRDHLEDAYQEALDQCMYLRAALEQRRKK